MPRRYLVKLIVAALALLLGVIVLLLQMQDSREPSSIEEVGRRTPRVTLEQPLHVTTVHLNGDTGDVAGGIGA
jgi:hypothetical protein